MLNIGSGQGADHAHAVGVQDNGGSIVAIDNLPKQAVPVRLELVCDDITVDEYSLTAEEVGAMLSEAEGVAPPISCLKLRAHSTASTIHPFTTHPSNGFAH